MKAIVYRNIPLVSENYKAGSDGHIYSFFKDKPKRLAESRGHGGKGYLATSVMYEDGFRRSNSVHKLVCDAFHGLKKSSKYTVSHIDGDKDNNKPENLKWETGSENHARKFQHGTHDSGTMNSRGKASKECLFVIRWLLKNTGLTHGQIGKIVGENRVFVSKISTGSRYKNVKVEISESFNLGGF